LEVIRYPDGPVPRFGSCYFVLRPAVSHRTTFTFGGSEKPNAVERLGTIDNFLPVLVPLFEEVAAGGTTPVPWPPFVAATLGVPNVTVRDLLSRLARELPMPRADASRGAPGRVLDSCIEAHVHGPIDLRSDVELLVADPAFVGTPTGEQLLEIGRTHGIPVQWHCGFRMQVRDVPEDFRGPKMRPLAERISSGGVIDAASIGAAEGSVHTRPDAWADWGSPHDTLQHLKQLWHVLVQYGKTSD